MKKTTTALLLSAFAALFLTACQSSKNYNVVLLGDIHYDKTELHDNTAYAKFQPKVPFAQGVLNKDGLFSWQKHTSWATESRGWDPQSIPANVKMWEKNMPALLDAAAAAAKKQDSRYVIQLGDMVQGDCGRQDLHEQMLSGGLNAMTSRFPCPALTVVGNHDTRGIGGAAAWKKIMEPHFDKSVKNIIRKGSNYYFFVGDDLFYFHDLMNPDLDFLEEALNRRSAVRYTFFISHVPVLPAEKRWIANVITDDPDRLIKLLLGRNAIVLSGHTHNTAIIHYDDRKTGRRITQFVMNSTLRNDLHKTFSPKVVYSPVPAKLTVPQNQLWDRVFSGKLRTELLTAGSGYTVLRIEKSGVFASYYNEGKAPEFFRLR